MNSVRRARESGISARASASHSIRVPNNRAHASFMPMRWAGIDGVKSATVSFMTQKLVLEADDDRFEAVLDEAQHACKKFEPDCVILR